MHFAGWLGASGIDTQASHQHSSMLSYVQSRHSLVQQALNVTQQALQTLQNDPDPKSYTEAPAAAFLSRAATPKRILQHSPSRADAPSPSLDNKRKGHSEQSTQRTQITTNKRRLDNKSSRFSNNSITLSKQYFSENLKKNSFEASKISYKALLKPLNFLNIAKHESICC